MHTSPDLSFLKLLLEACLLLSIIPTEAFLEHPLLTLRYLVCKLPMLLFQLVHIKFFGATLFPLFTCREEV